MNAYTRPETAAPSSLSPTSRDLRHERAADACAALDDELFTLGIAINNRSETDMRLENVLGRLQERVENGSASPEQARIARWAHRNLVRMDRLAHRIAKEMEDVA
jgi:hypothetical protein